MVKVRRMGIRIGPGNEENAKNPGGEEGDVKRLREGRREWKRMKRVQDVRRMMRVEKDRKRQGGEECEESGGGWRESRK